MRIVYVLTSLAMGGTERQVLAIAGRMAMRGHAVALLVLKPQEPDGCASELDVVYLDMGKSVASLVRGLRSGVSFLRGFQPDVMHSHNFHGNMLARMMRLLYPRVILISTIHNVYEGRGLRMLAYRLSDGLARRTTAVSKAVADRYVGLKAVPGSKCVVVTNGIEIAEFQPDEERRAAMRRQMGVSDEFVWLSVGRMTPAKDFPNMLQAFGKIWAKDPETQLWIAGATKESESGERVFGGFSVPHGTMDHVRWLGLRRDIPALLDAADGFVLGSAWEGMPLALGEAMAMEKPVVATDVGGVRELVGDAGMIVPAKDSSALAEAMLAMMREPQETRSALGRVARERICDRFSMDAKADEWELLYNSVLS
jgi:glycosyltransferase involved in cell wall biosynthesis